MTFSDSDIQVKYTFCSITPLLKEQPVITMYFYNQLDRYLSVQSIRGSFAIPRLNYLGRYLGRQQAKPHVRTEYVGTEFYLPTYLRRCAFAINRSVDKEI